MTLDMYVSWQMQCCGEPFAIGDKVTWTVGDGSRASDWLRGLEADGVDWAEEHHQDEFVLGSVTGTVQRIRSVWQDRVGRADDPRVLESVPGSQFTDDVTFADGWEDEGDRPSPHPGKYFEGYLVTLRE